MDRPMSWFFEMADQMDYRKVIRGRWIEEIVDDGQGFPKTIYHCPFCNSEGNGTNYCPECGARLKDETD